MHQPRLRGARGRAKHVILAKPFGRCSGRAGEWPIQTNICCGDSARWVSPHLSNVTSDIV
jgi:hypothetical protein